ncbi:hypothetical protein [Sinorhizobium sp. BG8]|uniref:hypothetical protein n=1 Tax=Sinorhizobium sp. BG8 TaxID=2613773 RepID=UPI00193DD285|nr:hypothetical protein [Sinorhizobium sp. BG8]QRM53700.1 hypothetical protein F3Y30_03350 [Sinorhizobium sp. BG8]
MSGLWPWVVLAGLGAFHGANPAMGWLFSVALGLHRQSRRIVWLSLIPIALGHAASIAIVLAFVVAFGEVLEPRTARIAAGVLILAMAAYHVLFGYRHRTRVGMRTGMAGLAFWSFLMATSHGAGLMLVPSVMALCAGAEMPFGLSASGSIPISSAAVAVHTAALLVVTAAIATAVFEWLGLAALRRAWINFDILWIFALAVTGLFLVFGSAANR